MYYSVKETTKIRRRKYESTKTKTRKHEDENAKVRRRKHESTKTKTRKQEILLSRYLWSFRHRVFASSSSYFLFSSSYFRVFVIALSWSLSQNYTFFCIRSFVFSSSYFSCFRVLRLLNKNAMALTEHRRI